MKEIQISPSTNLPIEIMTRRTAIFGISGSGKSNTATRCIELLLEAKEQVVLIDPKGEGWGLQTSANGKEAAFDIIIFGEPRGDIPELREEHAEQIADFVVESGRSVVLSLLGFTSDQSERRFVTRFFQRLYRLKSQQAKKTRTLIVLEEAHLFVPEQASGGVTEMVGAIKRIARQGRSAGIGLMVVDQRPQDVAKSIISQTELLICHQLVHKLDRDALREWIRAYDREGQGEEFLKTLAELEPGQAWVWSPAWLHLFCRAKIFRRKTFDSGATPDGSTSAAPKTKAAIDIDALRSHLATVVEQAKDNDPALLKKKIAELEARLSKEPIAAPAEIKEINVPAFDAADVTRMQESATQAQVAANSLLEAAAAVLQSIDRVGALVAKQSGRQQPAMPPRNIAARPVVALPPRRSGSGEGATIPPRQQALVNALAFYRNIGMEPINKSRHAAFVGRSNDGGYRNDLSSLRTAGLIDYPASGEVVLTPLGGQHVSELPDIRTQSDLHGLWLNRLPPRQAALLRELIPFGSEHAMPKDELASRVGRTNDGGFRNDLSAIRTLGLIDYPRTGTVCVSENLFPPLPR